MEKIIVTPEEMFEPFVDRTSYFNKIGYFQLDSYRNMLRLATEKAVARGNLMWYGYEHVYRPETKEHIFIKTGIKI